jgi:hypothetical protein
MCLTVDIKANAFVRITEGDRHVVPDASQKAPAACEATAGSAQPGRHVIIEL